MVLRPTQHHGPGAGAVPPTGPQASPLVFTSVWYHEKGSLPALSQWRARVVVVALSAPSVGLRRTDREFLGVLAPVARAGVVSAKSAFHANRSVTLSGNRGAHIIRLTDECAKGEGAADG
jgi:hypothetical protein